MGRLFGTDGIRGVSGEELTVDTGLMLGRALATVLMEKGIEHPLVLIGRDPRTSGDLFTAAISAGLIAGGTDAGDIGVTTTPCVAYLVRELGADAGVMISASHNPARYNGLKVFGADGYKLDDADEERVERMILGEEPVSAASWDKMGRMRDLKQENKRYIEHVIRVLRENGPDEGSALPKKRILFDLSCGSSCATARSIFTSESLYGFEADFIADEANGLKINDGCGSTCLSHLANAVVKGGYDMGFAFDGDADRCLAVDEKGRVLDGDMLIAAMAKDLKRRGALSENTAVVTVLTNLGFHLFCKEMGIEVAVTDVGDRYVLREMLRNGAGIGGEQSGHIIFPAYATTGDGQVTAAVALGLLARSGKTASEVFGEMKPLPQVARNVTVRSEWKEAVLKHEDLAKARLQAEQTLAGRGRVLIRPSGTESLIRIMLEGDCQEEINRIAGEIAEQIETICGAL